VSATQKLPRTSPPAARTGKPAQAHRPVAWIDVFALVRGSVRASSMTTLSSAPMTYWQKDDSSGP